jgi:hypothetical protein
MSAVFNHAVRWEWLDANPIRMVRQSAKRTRIPIVLSIEQVAALLRILKEPTRTMVFVAVFTGLRVGELLGLKWSDIDLQKMVVHVVRSIVMQHVGDCKTEASRKPVPLDLRLAKVLWDWRLQSPYPTDEDWVFASPHSGGKLPYWPGSLYKAHLEPAAKEVGIEGLRLQELAAEKHSRRLTASPGPIRSDFGTTSASGCIGAGSMPPMSRTPFTCMASTSGLSRLGLREKSKLSAETRARWS